MKPILDEHLITNQMNNTFIKKSIVQSSNNKQVDIIII